MVLFPALDSGHILWRFSDEKTKCRWHTESDREQRNAGQGDTSRAKQDEFPCSKGFGWVFGESGDVSG